MNTPEPITGPGILWALGQINKRFEQAAKTKPEVADSVPDGSESDNASFKQEPEGT